MRKNKLIVLSMLALLVQGCSNNDSSSIDSNDNASSVATSDSASVVTSESVSAVTSETTSEGTSEITSEGTSEGTSEVTSDISSDTSTDVEQLDIDSFSWKDTTNSMQAISMSENTSAKDFIITSFNAKSVSGNNVYCDKGYIKLGSSKNDGNLNIEFNTPISAIALKVVQYFNSWSYGEGESYTEGFTLDESTLIVNGQNYEFMKTEEGKQPLVEYAIFSFAETSSINISSFNGRVIIQSVGYLA